MIFSRRELLRDRMSTQRRATAGTAHIALLFAGWLVVLLWATTCFADASAILAQAKVSGGVRGEVQLEGVVTSIVNSTDFRFDDSQLVQTDAWTLLYGIHAVEDLQEGDLVYVEGWSEGDAVWASMVMVLDDGNQAVIDGIVSYVMDSTTFVLEDATVVIINARTILEGFSWILDLMPGDQVHVEGRWSNEGLLANLVRKTYETGEPISVSGSVAAVVTSTDFVLDSSVLVMTGPATILLGFQSVGDLLPGDLVNVFGVTAPEGIIAESVELLFTPNDPVLITGTVEEVLDRDRFSLTDGSVVVTDPWTYFIGIDTVLDLEPGDLVLTEGWWVGGPFLALWVELVQQAPDPQEVTGLLAYLDPPNAFVLDDLTRVEVTGETVWIALDGYEQLGVGDELRVLGLFDVGELTMTALEVERLAQPDPTWITREGWVEEVTGPLTVQLTDGVVLEVRPDAVLSQLDSVEDLGPGDRVWVGAYTTADPEILDVVRLELVERPGNLVDFVSVVESVDLANGRFSTANGYDVIVSDDTAFINIDGLSEIVAGDWVAVLGIAGTDPRHPQRVEAAVVEWRDGEDGGGGGGGGSGGGVTTTVDGTVTEMRGGGIFEIDFDLLIETTADTEWRGTLGAPEDLVVGTAVRAEVTLEDDGTMQAAWVEGYAPSGFGLLDIEGFVLEIDLADARLRLETGEWIEWDEFTRIDGDVGSVTEIQAGMHLTVVAVDLGSGNFLAFELFVELQVTDVQALGFPDDEIRETLVVLRDEAAASDVAVRHGAVVTGTLPGRLVYLFQWDEEIDLSVLQMLLDDEDVVVLEPNRLFSDPESDPESIRRRAIAIDRAATSDTFNDQDAVQKAGLDTAHTRSLGQGTMVAVIDTGVDPFHPLLRYRIAQGGYDFVDEDSLPWETADGIDQDDDGEVDEGAGHGTFVAGLVLLAAPATSILPFRVLNDDGRGSTFDISRAVLLAINQGADIINMSFAYPDRSRVLDRILMEASDRGVVLVSGAGNAGLADLPFPATDNRVLAVAAVDSDGRLADFSNRGVNVALGAPGIDLYSASLDAQFGTWSGTSMAAPLVSGAAALLRSVNPYLTPEQISAALLQGAAAAFPDDELQFVLQAGAAIDLVPDGP